MAITLNTTFEKGVSLQSSAFSFVSNAGDVTGTVGSGTNRVMLGIAAFKDTGGLATQSAVAMTWAGNSMTALTDIMITSNTYRIYLFGLKGDGAGGVTTGNQTLSVSWGTSGQATSVALGAVVFDGCDTTTGWQNIGTDTGTGLAAASTVTSANGNMAVIGHVNDNASSTAVTAGQGTAAWTETDLDGNYAQAYRASTSSSTVVSYDLGSSKEWANVKVDVIAAGGGAGTPVTKLNIGRLRPNAFAPGNRR